VIGLGNPRVVPGLPGPLPEETPGRGMGFCQVGVGVLAGFLYKQLKIEILIYTQLNTMMLNTRNIMGYYRGG